MPDHLSNESKTGAMLRYIMGDVSASFKQTLRELYEPVLTDDKETDPIKVAHKCADRHWMLIKFFSEPEETRQYVFYLQQYADYAIDPDSQYFWKKTMRVVIPEQFIRKVAGMTQVPQAAVMDEEHAERMRALKDEFRNAEDVTWYDE
jgi:hypothetical protein